MYMMIPNSPNQYFCAVFLVEMKQSLYLNDKVATQVHMLVALTELYANYAKCDELNVFFVSRTYTFTDERYFMSTCSNCFNSFKFTSLALQFPDHQKYEASELFLWHR